MATRAEEFKSATERTAKPKAGIRAKRSKPGVPTGERVKAKKHAQKKATYALEETAGKAIRDYVAGTEHSTILGKIKFAGSENVGTPGTVSQWQKGEFEVVWPKSVATAALNPVKPAW